MKDKQAKAPASTGSIPIVSPILHCVAMPLLVIFRHNFGYSYLSPKSIFLSSIFATCLLSYIVWHEGALKPRFLFLSVFALVASLLYLFHLIRCISKQTLKTAEHDQFTGKSYLAAIIPSSKAAKAEGLIHCVAEPAIALLVGLIIAPDPLGGFLMFAGISLALKELIRNWLSIRSKKRMADNLEDAEEINDVVFPEAEKPLTADGRTARERFSRS